MQMEIEEAALKKETDRLSKERLENLQKELADQREEFANRKAQWDNEKNSVEKLRKLREEIDRINSQIQAAQQNYDLNKACLLYTSRAITAAAPPLLGIPAAAPVRASGKRSAIRSERTGLLRPFRAFADFYLS